MAFTFPAPGSRRGKELLAKLPENKLRFLAQQLNLGEVPRDPGERILFFGNILRKVAQSIFEPLRNNPEYNLISTNALVEYFYRAVMNDKIDPIDLPLYIEPFRWYFSVRHQPSVLREFDLTDNLQLLDPGKVVAAYQRAGKVKEVATSYVVLWERFRQLMHTEYADLIIYEDNSMIIYHPQNVEENKHILSIIGNHIHVCVGLRGIHFNYYAPMFVGVFHPSVIKPGIDFKATRSNPYDGLVYAIATFGEGKEFHLPNNRMVPIDEEPYATYATRMLDVIAEKYPQLVEKLGPSEDTIEQYIDTALYSVREVLAYNDNTFYIPTEILRVFVLYQKNKFEEYINLSVIADLIKQFVNIAIDHMGEVKGVKDLHEYFNVELPEDIEKRKANRSHYRLAYSLFKQYIGKWIEHEAYPDVVASLYKNMSTTGCFEYFYSAINPENVNYDLIEKIINSDDILDYFDEEWEEKVEEMVKSGIKTIVDYIKDMVKYEVIEYLDSYYELNEEPHIVYYMERGLIDTPNIKEAVESVVDGYLKKGVVIDVYPIEEIIESLESRRLWLDDVIGGEKDEFEKFIYDIFDIPTRYRKYFNSLFVQLSLPL